MSLFLVKEEMAWHMPDEGLGAADLQAWSTLNRTMKLMTVTVKTSQRFVARWLLHETPSIVA